MLGPLHALWGPIYLAIECFGQEGSLPSEETPTFHMCMFCGQGARLVPHGARGLAQQRSAPVQLRDGLSPRPHGAARASSGGSGAELGHAQGQPGVDVEMQTLRGAASTQPPPREPVEEVQRDGPPLLQAMALGELEAGGPAHEEADTGGQPPPPEDPAPDGEAGGPPRQEDLMMPAWHGEEALGGQQPEEDMDPGQGKEQPPQQEQGAAGMDDPAAVLQACPCPCACALHTSGTLQLDVLPTSTAHSRRLPPSGGFTRGARGQQRPGRSASKRRASRRRPCRIWCCSLLPYAAIKMLLCLMDCWQHLRHAFACKCLHAQLGALSMRPSPDPGTVRVEKLADGVYSLARHMGSGKPRKYVGALASALPCKKFNALLGTLGSATDRTPKALHALLVAELDCPKDVGSVASAAALPSLEV